MAKPEWGFKRVCPSCDANYYDMRRDPALCPTCGAPYHPEALLKTRRARPEPAPEEPVEPLADEEIDAKAATEEVADEEGEALPEGNEDQEEVIEDPSELGEDEDDVAEVIENAEDKEP
jgi:uncharacterized protein (TIGR02300 family)